MRSLRRRPRVWGPTPHAGRRAEILAGTLAAIALLLGACASLAPQRPGRPDLPDRPTAPEPPSGLRANTSTVIARRHMAAAANPHAAQAGLDILRAGGSAVDAAIAMQMVLGLVEPQSSGIGGGAFLLHWDGQRVQSFDGRETAPAAVTESLFLDARGQPLSFMDAVVGGRAVGVPGVLRMLEAAHRQHGRLPWKQLFQPAIALARQGFALSPRLHAVLTDEHALIRDPAARAYFYAADGRPKAIGTLLMNPAYAETLSTIAEAGADAFYRGPLAQAIAGAARGHPVNPGGMQPSDLAAYEAKERPPVCTDYKRWRVCGMGPPSSGGVAVAQMLGILARRNIAVVPPQEVDGRLEPQDDAVHLFSEAGRLAYADRAVYVADPEFVRVDIAALTDPAYLATRARLITDRSMGTASAGTPTGGGTAWSPDRSPWRTATSHLSVVDDAGHAVAMTTSIEDAFGARLMVRGFLLNNQLTDFSFAPRGADGTLVANRAQAGKRPRSAMAPALVFDRASGELVAAIGSPGGSLIINYVMKTLVGVLDWSLDIDTAIALPNFGSRNGPTELELGRTRPALADALRRRGHEVREIPMTSGLQGIVRIVAGDGSRAWAGGADPRREGVALGD